MAAFRRDLAFTRRPAVARTASGLLGVGNFMGRPMRRASLFLSSLTFALAASATAVMAQIDPLNPVPGGATGSNVFCVQAGDLNTGAFVATFSRTSGGKWEERRYQRPGSVSYEETARAAETVELLDKSSSASIQFDFARKKIRSSQSQSSGDWVDMHHMLSATDEAGSADCVSLASRMGAADASGGRGRNGAVSVQLITVRPGTLVVIPPGTKLTATSGPPCPGQPGFFLCPNKFTCAQDGGVCCPGAGSCAPGTFCDRFIPLSCIGPGDPAFCPGTGNVLTGFSLHCAPGQTCGPGNLCN